MCGILGVFSANGLTEKIIDESTFEKMLGQLHHRGPDESSYIIHNHIWLGHSRLSIIDVSSGQQPMGCEDESVYITFNGEIFNYIELRENFEQQGVKFRTQSDTEVLLAAYKKYGKHMFQYINGQYAFCIWDKKRNLALLGRDHAGILPIFYTFLDGTLFFSSTIKALLQHPRIQSRLNLKALKSLFTFWVPIGDLTFFEGIYQLSPGEYLTICDEGTSKGKHWDISFTKTEESKSLSDWQEAVRFALEEAVKIRLRADVPVGSYVSGGLDSSILTMLADKHQSPFLTTFSMRFADTDYDETIYQELLEAQYGNQNHSILLSTTDINNSYEAMILAAEQPVYRTAPVPLYYLSRNVSDHKFRVVLTGEGADEIAWGYNIFKETSIRVDIAAGVSQEIWQKKLSSLYPYLEQFGSRYTKLMMSFYLSNSNNLADPLFSHAIRIKNGMAALQFMSQDMRAEIEKYDVEQDFIDTLPTSFSEFNPLQKAQYIEMKTLLAGYLLSSQGDRMSMAHSVETRYPFLDRNVIALFSTMPDDLKLKGMNEKYILKESFKAGLPEAIVERPKQPYRAPESSAILKGQITDRYFTEESFRRFEIFDYSRVTKLIKKLEVANRKRQFNFNDNFALNCIASTQIFYDRFIQNNIEPSPKKSCYKKTLIS